MKGGKKPSTILPEKGPFHYSFILFIIFLIQFSIFFFEFFFFALLGRDIYLELIGFLFSPQMITISMLYLL